LLPARRLPLLALDRPTSSVEGRDRAAGS